MVRPLPDGLFLHRYADGRLVLPNIIDTITPGEVDAATRDVFCCGHSHEKCLRQPDGLGLARRLTDVISGHGAGSAGELKAGLIASRSRGAEGVVIGDTEADVLAGKSLDMITVAVTSGLWSRRYLRGHRPDYLLDSIAALLGVL